MGLHHLCFLHLERSPPVNTSAQPALVEFKSVRFGYGERLILDDVSFQIPKGKVTALMGASGGGKTTVLRLIGGQYFAQ